MAIAESYPPARPSPLLDASIIGAMAVAAMAFVGGLVAKANIGLLPSLIAGAALFLMMASSHAVLRRAASLRPVEAPEPFFVAAPAPSDFDPARAQQLDMALSRLDQIDARLSRIEDMAQSEESLGDLGARLDWLERVASNAERQESRADAMRAQIQIELRQRDDAIRAELQVLETLMKQTAEGVAARPAARPCTADRAPFETPAMSLKPDRGIDEPAAARKQDRAMDNIFDQRAVRIVPEPAPQPTGLPEHQRIALDAELLEVVRQSIEYNKVELYLQPIVSLPQRNPLHYEALTRLKTRAGDLVLPRDYMRVAEPAGMMPLIDNVMLFRSVQVLRRLADRQNGRGVFCNISVHSLLDPEFFPEFVAFMEQNRNLNDSLCFEFAQPVVARAGAAELDNLATLASLGFRFSLDHVTDLNLDFAALHTRGFRFVKIDARTFCDGMKEAGARIHPADMNAYLARFGIELIVEKIEDERAMSITLSHGVKLGQGYLFSEPKPVRAEVFADAA